MIQTRRRTNGTGSIQLEGRKSGPSVWVYRYRETREGRRAKCKVVLGTIEEIGTREDAERAAAPYFLISNRENPHVPPPSMEALMERYLTTQLPARAVLADTQTPVPDGGDISDHCAESYRSVIKCWIRPRWTRRPDGRPYLVKDFASITMSTAIEEWLKTLLRSERNPGGLARKSVVHIFAVMKLLFKYAVKWGYLGRSPMGNKYEKLVELPRGSTKRTKKIVQLGPAQFLQLLPRLGLLARLACAIAGWLGPRRSEGFGLKWLDIDFLNRVVHFHQGVVEGRVSGLKTEASQDDLPLPDEVARLLLAWRSQTVYREPGDWVFASPYSKGKRPYWPGQLMKSHIQPVAVQAGFGKIGWHSFRHSYLAWGKAAGLGTQQLKELLRDETTHMVNDYGSTDVEAKREAQQRVARHVKRVAAGKEAEEPGTIQ